jgi:hypothetical protein
MRQLMDLLTGLAVLVLLVAVGLRELVGQLLTQEQTFRAIAEEIIDFDICYAMGADRGERDPLVGRWAPNLTLHLERDKTSLAERMCAGRGVLVDLAERSELRKVATNWADQVEVTSARCYERPANLDAMLVRPDGYVAWALRSAYGDIYSHVLPHMQDAAAEKVQALLVDPTTAAMPRQAAADRAPLAETSISSTPSNP